VNTIFLTKSRKNPYAKRLKRQVTIRLDTAAVDYFKDSNGPGYALSERHQSVPEGLRDAKAASCNSLAPRVTGTETRPLIFT
jgi:uncharacterized protein (DUF4415 family)